MKEAIIKREYWPKKEWKTIDPASVGIDMEKLIDLDHRIQSQYRSINGIVIVRNGYIVFKDNLD